MVFGSFDAFEYLGIFSAKEMGGFGVPAAYVGLCKYLFDVS